MSFSFREAVFGRLHRSTAVKNCSSCKRYSYQLLSSCFSRRALGPIKLCTSLFIRAPFSGIPVTTRSRERNVLFSSGAALLSQVRNFAHLSQDCSAAPLKNQLISTSKRYIVTSSSSSEFSCPPPPVVHNLPSSSSSDEVGGSCRDLILASSTLTDSLACAASSSSTSSEPCITDRVWASPPPTIVSSSCDKMKEETMLTLVEDLERRRLARQEKMFENLLVFEGGAVSDHTSLGKEMIMRDFVFFSLYHHKWGYYPKLFLKYRQLMTTGYFNPIPFNALRSQYDFERYAGKLHETTPGFVSPTQLFYPYYGWTLAEYLITTHRAKFDPREPLIIYDIGGGTGALAVSLLDYLAEHFPEMYDTCEYHVIEMNPYLIPILRTRLVHHYHHVHIHHLSFLNWRQCECRRCFVLAVELFSGLPHDVIVWDNKGIVSEQWFQFTQHDNLSSAEESYRSAKDPAILRYLRYLNWLQEESYHALKVLCVTGGRETIDPPPYGSLDINYKDNLLTAVSKILWVHSPWRTAWLPTAQMLLLEVLSKYFPRHHFMVIDWNTVRQALPGFNAPVLQVKVRVAKDLYLRRPIEALHTNAGMMDICFPTDFEHLETVYRRICGAEKELSCMSHPEFWKIFGGEKTALYCTKSGFNPLLEDFSQLSVFTAHHSPEY